MSIKRVRGTHGFLHWVFESTLFLKSIFALFEIAAGLGLWLVPHWRINQFVGWLTHNQLIDNRRSPVFVQVSRALSDFSLASQHFYALYLLAHGAIKLAIIIMLMRQLRFAYPLGMLVFTGFIILQMHRWTHTHSPALLALSVLDAVVIWLTWREWRR